MSTSSVSTIAPCSVAQIPPTTIASALCVASVRKMSTKSELRIVIAKFQNSPHVALKHLKALGRRHRKHPVDQGDIDTITPVWVKARIEVRRMAGFSFYG